MAPPWAPTPGTRNGRPGAIARIVRELVGRRGADDETDRPARAPARREAGDALVEALRRRARAPGRRATSRSWSSPAPGFDVRHRT